jgi:Ca2+/Na+ antiporter
VPAILKINNRSIDDFIVKSEDDRLKIYESELKYRFREIYPHLNSFEPSKKALIKAFIIVIIVLFIILMLSVIILIFSDKINSLISLSNTTLQNYKSNLNLT